MTTAASKSRSSPGTAPARWHTLEPACRFTPRSLAETLDGGQAFRWHLDGNGVWVGQWAGFSVRLRLDSGNRLQWSSPKKGAPDLPDALRTYLGSDREFPALTDSLPWRSDGHLAAAIEAFPGLRILRQPLSETLLAFLCSATKQIPQIKRMLANLADRFGREDCGSLRRLPDWPALDGVPEEALRACGLGFRARYIKAVARILADDPGWEKRLENLSYPDARESLMRLPGVGEKVADCVLLFGAGKLAAFPVDTWILKVMRNRYDLDGWTNTQVAHFGRTHFGPAAGLAQQYLFAYERSLRSNGASPHT